jgi:class 3 adenylate cyclase/tetratricopeptide (TPR) repeat protein
MSQEGDLPTQSELAAALRKCLPSSLERKCLLGDEINHPHLCAQHIAALLRAISTYLPRYVVTPLLANPEPGKVEGRFSYGTVMFADISGFTAMSEKLSQLGKAGAEEITAIVNRFFTALLEVTDQYGADLLKFGGDALLLLFDGEDHALRACLAALQMQDTMARFSETATSQGVFQLRMTIGLGTGPLFMARLGTEEGMEFAVMGAGLAHMAQAEDQASAGEIFVDAETHQAIAEQAITGKTQDGFHQLVGVQGEVPDLDGAAHDPLATLEPPPPGDTLLPWIADKLRCIQALELFLPPGLMDKIKLDPERIAIGGEYRPVTVFFANFYGIDEIIEELGEARSAEITAILNAHFTTMRRIIAKYGGVVNKVDTYAVGHRIMALFGAPRAHVDDPERAVRAALEMQEAMTSFTELSTSCGSFCLKQRIGVNTGLVFAGNVGSPTRQEYSVMGDEVNLTARLMAVAAEGQVLISQSTARQSNDAFLLHEQKPVRVKGKSLPVHNYGVLGLQERHVGERRPLVGRDEEWQAIHALIDLGLIGETQVLTIVGDVGLGKSRLITEVSAHWTEEHGALSINATCPSFGRHTPYQPWLDLLRALFGFKPGDSTQVRLEKIDALLQEVNPSWHDWAVLIGRLLGLDVEEPSLVRSLDARTRQRTIFRVVTGLVDHVASEQPLLLTIDDLQWADDTSIELVNQVARQVAGRPLMLVLAYRPEETLASNLKVEDLPYHTSLRLEELSEAASLRLLDTLLPTTPQMPLHLKRLILDKARGNPLFIEEVAHSLIENYLTLDEETNTYHARADLEQIEVPDSVNRVIMSRIDRLDESSRNLLRVASVIGQEFQHWLLSAIYPYRQAEGELSEQLDELSQREILEGPYADLLYLFRHILTREVAYESLLYADRRHWHRRIGESIEAQRGSRLVEYWEVLAYHFSLAEEWEKALQYRLQAGLKAQSIYANEDAIHHFQQALKAAQQVPDSEDRQLEAHERLSEVLDTQGEYDAALEHIYQAQDLVMVVGWPAQDQARRLADLCRKTAAIYEKKSDYDTAFNWLHGGLIALEGLEAIEAARIHLVGAGIYHRQGHNADALRWCQRSLELASQLENDNEARLKVLAHAYHLQGAIYTRYGDNDRVLEMCDESLRIYQRIGDIAGASQAHINMATAYFNRAEWQKATYHYRRALEIKERVGDVYGRALVANNLAGIYLNQGQLDRAEELYRESLKTWETLGSIYGAGFLHNNLAGVFLSRRDWDRAAVHLDRSLELFQQIESVDLLPEVYRRQALVSLGRGDLEAALDWGQRSLEQAVQQEGKLEEGATRRVLGQAHATAGEHQKAEQYLKESLDILEALDTPYEVGQTLFQLALLYRGQRRSAEADAALTRAIDIFERLGAQLDLKQARDVREEDRRDGGADMS